MLLIDFLVPPYESDHLPCVERSIECQLSNASQENPLHQLSIPQNIADKLWQESGELASSESDICASPGCVDGSMWLVKSTVPTHQRPFFVECRKTGQVSCEKSCALFHSCGVCAHTVAVAKKKSCLDSLVKWLSKRDDLNVMQLANSGLPKGSGKEEHTRRKFSSKSSTKNVKKMLLNVSDEVFTPRTGVTTKSASAAQPILPPETMSVNTTSVSLSNPSYLPCVTLPHVPPPLTSVPLHETPPLLFPDLQSCSYSYSLPVCPQSPASVQQLCGPPPLIRAPIQVSMPVMYAPMYCSQNPELQKQCDETPFCLVFVKGNISKCGGCGKKDLRDLSGETTPSTTGFMPAAQRIYHVRQSSYRCSSEVT